MSRLFESSEINGMKLPNRFVRSATWEGMATVEGAATPKLIETMAALARGGVGLIVSGHAYVRPEGQATPWQLGAHRDGLLPGLRGMAEAVHRNGGMILLQLAHAGTFADQDLTGEIPLAVSKPEEPDEAPRKEIMQQDIQALVSAFAEAAGRAKAAGFDGIQIHSAHTYLLSQFLSPAFNRRTDEYGGSILNRTRIHLAILDAIRKVVGRDYPVLIKMNAQDYMKNGLTLEESPRIARLLADAGFDAIEVSGGPLRGIKLSPTRPKIDSEEKEAYFREDARAIRKATGVPLILVGGIRSFNIAERVVEEGIADYISMSRPFIREPELINRWKAGNRRRAACTSDNLCFGPAFKDKGISCVTREREELKQKP